MNYWIGGPEMLYEKTNDVIYELSCFSVNMLFVNKKEDVIPEIQNTVKRLSGLFEDLNLKLR
jgi:hypothetical protein